MNNNQEYMQRCIWSMLNDLGTMYCYFDDTKINQLVTSIGMLEMQCYAMRQKLKSMKENNETFWGESH